MNTNQKGFANIILVVVIVILVGAVGYFAFVKKSEPIAQQPTPTPTQTTTPTKTPVSPTPTPTPKDETVNWKAYADNTIGLSFKYPSTWTINNYNKSPNILVYSSLISSLSTSCGELGTCQQYELNNKKIIEDGSMSGIISFNGGKGSLIATCSGNEGGDLVPTPFYKFKFYKGDRLYEISLNDLSTKLSANSDCNSSKYIQDLVKSIPNSISNSNYKTYNDLLVLIKQTLILK